MRKALILAVAMLSMVVLSSGVAFADEWYYGENGDQPRTGASDSPGPGIEESPGVGGDVDTGLRLRFKDE